MKKSICLLVSLFLISVSSQAGDDEKLTFKEKAEQQKELKIFFDLREIVDEKDELALKSSNPNAKTSIRTKIPDDFSAPELKALVLTNLNQGLELSNVFMEGDINTIPEVNNNKTQNRDFSKLPDGLYALAVIEGEYKRNINKKTVEGKVVMDVSNGMEIKARLYFFEVKGGVVEKYGEGFSKSGVLIASAQASYTKTEQLQGLEYMEKTFPASALIPEYKRTLNTFTQDFAKNQLKKHNKTVSKRK